VTETSDRLSPVMVADRVQAFEARYGRTSLYLAAHAAVAHRLRPEIVALTRTNFLPSPHRFQAAHDADVLFGPLCTFQGDGFFEMQPEIKDFLVDVLDRIFSPGPSGRFRSQDVARMLRHHLRKAAAEPHADGPRYERFRQENLWRAIAIDDPLTARDHMRAHARARDGMAREALPGAPRGAGIVSVAGPVLGLFQEDMAYLEVQDMIADGRDEEAVAVLELMVETWAEVPAALLLSEERMFLTRRRNMAGEAGTATGAKAPARPSAAPSAFANDLKVDRARLDLRDTALTRAALAGDAKALEAALAAPDPELDQLDRYGLAALHHAVRGGHPELALRLLDASADINVTSAYDAPPLFFMAMHGLTDLARTFLERGATLLQFSAKKSSPLMSAAWYGHRDLVVLYLAQPAIDEDYVNARNDEGLTALAGALSVGDARIRDMLVAAGARLEKPATQGYTHLHAAAAGGSPELVEWVLRAGYPVDALTSDGWSPLHIACSNTPSLDVARLLLDCGADPWRENVGGWTPVRLAAWWDNLDILRHFGDLGAPLVPQLVRDAAGGGASAVLDYLLVDRAVPTDLPGLVDPMIRSGKPAAAEYLLARADAFGAKHDHVFAKAVEYGKHEIVALYRKRGWALPASVETPPKSDGEAPTVSNTWVGAMGRTSEGWRELATVLLDWPEARALAADRIFEKSVEMGEAGVLRRFRDLGLPPPAPASAGSPGSGVAAAQPSWLPMLAKAQAGWRETMEVLLGWPAFREVAASELFEDAVARGHLDVSELFEHNGWPSPGRPKEKPGWAWVIGKGLPQRDALTRALLDWPDTPPNPDGEHRLMNLAAESGLVQTLAELIRRGEPIDVTERANETPLSAAVVNAQWAAARLLLQAGADPNLLTGRRHEPVFFRAAFTATPLLREHGADLRRRALDGRSLLHVVAPAMAQPGAEAVLAAALEAGLAVDAVDVAGSTALHLAAELDDPAAAKALLAAGASLDARTAAGLTPLLLALSRGRRATADALLAAGADPTARTFGGTGLLHIAAEQDMVDLLRRYWTELGGPTVLSLRPARTVLQTAVEADARGAVDALLELGADPEGAAGSSLPPLRLAVRANRYEIAERLLAAGASPAAGDPVVGHDALSDLTAQQRLLAATETSVPAALTSLLARLGAPPGGENRTSASFLAEPSEPAWSGWRFVPYDAVGTYARVLHTLDAGRYSGNTLSQCVRRPLSFYPGVHLARLQSKTWGGSPRAVFLLVLPGKTLWLDGASQPIFQANALLGLQLTVDTALDYLRFFCFFVRSQGAPFYVVEDPGDPNLAELRRTRPELVESIARPASLETGVDGIFRARAAILFDNHCFRAAFDISPAGLVTMTDDEPVATGLVRLELPIR